jgi:hypothetical protein
LVHARQVYFSPRLEKAFNDGHVMIACRYIYSTVLPRRGWLPRRAEDAAFSPVFPRPALGRGKSLSSIPTAALVVKNMPSTVRCWVGLRGSMFLPTVTARIQYDLSSARFPSVLWASSRCWGWGCGVCISDLLVVGWAPRLVWTLSCPRVHKMCFTRSHPENMHPTARPNPCSKAVAMTTT